MFFFLPTTSFGFSLRRVMGRGRPLRQFFFWGGFFIVIGFLYYLGFYYLGYWGIILGYLLFGVLGYFYFILFGVLLFGLLGLLVFF